MIVVYLVMFGLFLDPIWRRHPVDTLGFIACFDLIVGLGHFVFSRGF